MTTGSEVPDVVAAERYAAVLPMLDNPLFDGFWEGTRARQVRMPRCEDCGEFHWYPMHRCPHCGSTRLVFAPAGETATLFTWAIIRRPLHPGLQDRIGEIVALVLPDRAPKARLVTNLVGVEPEDLRKGLVLEPEFTPVTTDVVLALYRPAPVDGEQSDRAAVDLAAPETG
jgi:hypothetical protein